LVFPRWLRILVQLQPARVHRRHPRPAILKTIHLIQAYRRSRGLNLGTVLQITTKCVTECEDKLSGQRIKFKWQTWVRCTRSVNETNLAAKHCMVRVNLISDGHDHGFYRRLCHSYCHCLGCDHYRGYRCGLCTWSL
jgi:hypothetical protein